MKITRNYQLRINGELYNVYKSLAEASKIIRGLRLIREDDFTYEIVNEVNIIKVLRTGTKVEDFSKLTNNTLKKIKIKKKKIKKEKEIKHINNTIENVVF